MLREIVEFNSVNEGTTAATPGMICHQCGEVLDVSMFVEGWEVWHVAEDGSPVHIKGYEDFVISTVIVQCGCNICPYELNIDAMMVVGVDDAEDLETPVGFDDMPTTI